MAAVDCMLDVYFNDLISIKDKSRIILAVWETRSQMLAPAIYLSRNLNGDVLVMLNWMVINIFDSMSWHIKKYNT